MFSYTKNTAYVHVFIHDLTVTSLKRSYCFIDYVIVQVWEVEKHIDPTLNEEFDKFVTMKIKEKGSQIVLVQMCLSFNKSLQLLQFELSGINR